MYYRGVTQTPEGEFDGEAEVTCYAESTDGIVWTKPNLGLHEYQGRREQQHHAWARPAAHLAQLRGLSRFASGSKSGRAFQGGRRSFQRQRRSGSPPDRRHQGRRTFPLCLRRWPALETAFARADFRRLRLGQPELSGLGGRRKPIRHLPPHVERRWHARTSGVSRLPHDQPRGVQGFPHVVEAGAHELRRKPAGKSLYQRHSPLFP